MSIEAPPAAAELCDHARVGAWPWRTRLIIDEHLGPTDAVMVCCHCGQRCLLQTIDWAGQERAMRVGLVDAAEADGVARDLNRGSCDVNRAGAELSYLLSRARAVHALLCVDAGGPTITARAPVNAADLPRAGWRDLPCDGRWVRYARSNSVMSNA